MSLPLKQVAAFVFSWIQILPFYLFAVSGHEELRAKHRFRKVTGKEHLHLTQEKFSELLGTCMCTVLFFCPIATLVFLLFWAYDRGTWCSIFHVCVDSTLYRGSIQICWCWWRWHYQLWWNSQRNHCIPGYEIPWGQASRWMSHCSSVLSIKHLSLVDCSCPLTNLQSAHSCSPCIKFFDLCSWNISLNSWILSLSTYLSFIDSVSHRPHSLCNTLFLLLFSLFTGLQCSRNLTFPSIPVWLIVLETS